MGDTPIEGDYIPKIRYNSQLLGPHTLIHALMRVTSGEEEATIGKFFHAKFHLHKCNICRLRDENRKNGPLK